MANATTSSAHTAGPWRIEYDRSIFSGGDGIVDNNDVIVAHLEPWTEDLPGTAKANAHLIAAAPELLAALKFAVESPDDEQALKMAEAAIAKAEGRG